MYLFRCLTTALESSQRACLYTYLDQARVQWATFFIDAELVLCVVCSEHSAINIKTQFGLEPQWPARRQR